MNKFLCIALSFLLLSSYASADRSEVQRLKKGEYYFYYLTGDYPKAMNQISQWRSTTAKSEGSINMADEADVMEATILLSLGLYKQAEKIYLQIKEKGRKVSSKTWFYLAQRWFEVENYEAALYSIENIDSAEVDANIIAESQFMKATSYIELAMYKESQQQIEAMARSDIWAGYARHNFLLAMFYGNNSGKSLPMLINEAIFFLPQTTEGKNLKDRIYLISAINSLQENNPRDAEKYLREISLDGPFTSVALLHFGWALLEQGRYESALQPWRELQERYDNSNPDVMESMVAVPQILELLKAQTQSLKAFEAVEVKLSTLTSEVIHLQAGIDSNPWMENWIDQQESQEWGSQSDRDDALILSLDNKILKELLIDQSFLNKMSEYRDYVLLTNYLTEKESSLSQWRTIVQQRERESKVTEAALIIRMTDEKLSAAKAGLLHLQDYLNKSNEDLFSLTSNEEAARFKTLVESSEVITDLIKENKASRDIEDYKKRWTRVKGVFIWQMNEHKPVKRWALKKQLLATEKAIKDTELQLSETQLAKQWSPESWDGMTSRIDGLLKKITTIKQRALSSRDTSKTTLIRITKEYLNDLAHRVNDYLAKARISIARLYDEALQKNISSGSFTGRER